MSSIQEFYSNQTIFLTGATGFIGKLIMEKLLRSCYDLDKIYILVRQKYHKTQEERLKEIFEQPCFDLLRTLRPDFQKKIDILNGDCSEPFLGLSEQAQTVLKNEVTCVINAAANVRFDVDLKTATYTNVRSLRDLLQMIKDMRKLKVFVHVSTAYTHCILKNLPMTIEEKLYDSGIDPDNLLQIVEIMDKSTLDAVTPHLLGQWPNTYAYTKAAAEELIRNYNQELPIVVVRPAIVISTYESPMAGWVDNLQGLVGVVIGASLGVLTTLQVDTNSPALLVPADFVVNNILAAAWARHEYQAKGETVSIYNFIGINDSLNTWEYVINEFMKLSLKYPLSSAVWYSQFKFTPYKTIHKIREFFSHYVFAYLVDCLLFMARKKPIAVEKYKKIRKLTDTATYFSTHSWNFSHKNVSALWKEMDENDRKLFNFNMHNLDWVHYFRKCMIVGRIHLMKDPLETIPQARRKMYILAIIHYALQAFGIYLLYIALRSLVNVILY